MRFACLLVLAVALCACAPAADAKKIEIENIVVKLGTGTIAIDAPVLNGTGQTVGVHWHEVGSKFPGLFDWIGVYSPKPDNWTKTYPSKYMMVLPDAKGSGTVDLWLLNMRDSYTVAYFTGGLDNPVLLAVSEPVEFSNYHLPMQLHLAYTDDPTQMVVQWTTQQNMFPSLQFGTSANKLDNTVMRVNSSTYKASDLCGAPASAEGWRAPGFLHQALLTGLTPNTEYFYTVGDESSFSKSDVLSFFTAPVPSPETEVDFIIFGDLGQVETDGSNEATEMVGSIQTTVAMQVDFAEGVIAKNRSAAVFHIGDISYARGYATLWEQFFYQISNMSGSIPWMTCDGNHERDWLNSGSLFTGRDSGGECGVAYERRFRMPTSSLDNTWWSLNYGPVHFVVLSTEHAFAVGTPQYEWVAADLAAVNRSQTPFVVLTGHRPMYIDSTFGGPGGSDLGVATDLRTAYEPLMQKYQVDVAFWGSVEIGMDRAPSYWPNLHGR